MSQAERAKIGRNGPCPCGSGKKYKRCCWNPASNTKLRWTVSDATHELGHVRFFLPEPPWHIGAGDFDECPFCQGVPTTALPSQDVSDTQGHSRNEMNGPYSLTMAEVVLMKLAGGAAEVACCGDHIRQRDYFGDGILYPAGMDGDLIELRGQVGAVRSAVIEYLFEALVEFFRAHKDELLRYAEAAVEKGAIGSGEVTFTFDPAPLMFRLFPSNKKFADAHARGICYKCGKPTACWGWCIPCRQNHSYTAAASSASSENRVEGQ